MSKYKSFEALLVKSCAVNQTFGLFGAAIGAIAMSASAAHAAVSISANPTMNMSRSGGVCSPTAKAAVFNVGDLQNMLASGNVEVTTAGTGVQANEIKVSAALTWVSANTLTLVARHSIVVNQPVTDSGPGGLTIVTDDGGSGGSLLFEQKGNVNFWGLTNKLTINGVAYALAGNIQMLAADIAANPSGNYALANSYDASVDGTYGQSPVSTTFTGSFNGLGNAISNLSIQTGAFNVGLFAEAAGTISGIGLLNVNVVGGSGNRFESALVGALVGWANGATIENSFATGSVRAGKADVGGLIGYAASGSITRCYTTIRIKGGGGAAVGGLAGVSDDAIGIGYSHSNATVSGGYESGGLVGENRGPITQSYATGEVSGSRTAHGGLAGVNRNSITQSYATATVKGSYYAGGLVGANTGIVQTSYATGSVSAAIIDAGGLVGDNEGGTITQSYATGKVSAAEYGTVGGLAGANYPLNSQGGAISTSYATGAVSGGDNATAGGLVGVNTVPGVDLVPGGTIDQSYASGSVTAGANATVGGLVGYNETGTIGNSYAIGPVSAGSTSLVGGLVGKNGYNTGGPGIIANSYSAGSAAGGSGSTVGGLIGFDTPDASSLTDTYWDTTTSGFTNLSQGAGNIANDPGIMGLTSAQLQSGLPAGFSGSIWGENASINNGLPYLLAIPPK